MILRRLRDETRLQHEALEEALPLGQANLGRDEYSGLLRRFYGFYATWEEQAEAHAGPELASVIHSRAKLPLLAADLAAFGMEAAHCSRMEDSLLPSFDAEPGVLLGSMYVVEGSTLGGQVISRRLEAMQGFRNGVGYSFFQSYGRAVGQQWRGFTALLEAAPEEDGDAIVRGARHTFSAFAAWFAQGGFARSGMSHATEPVPER